MNRRDTQSGFHGSVTRSVRAATAWILIISASIASAQYGAPDGEWPNFGGDLGNTKYSALDQINQDNFQDLEIWVWVMS